ncbi:right-handed parallel beta-helix repeat-containing protein [Paenibacillus sp. F411]|uniref:right-handed parallel beta-helix repeat-containing protein n=1 Tax=Paenibacillus sp. F411 TaxID=2820239 RepID=UPI001AAE6267|nr:right-handed parallel beta-helix repeat-containing protein [Paenibacillus sp. F411]MBO2942374.1 right-handed parallel beta-helix repeat-containing protein [Paenibacillus sp. F411]
MFNLQRALPPLRKSVLYAVMLSLTLFTAPTVSQAASVTCSTASCLTSALANAQPGDVITLAAGVTFTGNFVAAKNGTASAKITIKGASSTNKPILNGGTTSSGYALYITGDHYDIRNVKVTNAKKGIMLDHANYTWMEYVDVYSIGEEGVHYRDGSSNNTIKNSTVSDTGKLNPEYGEGVYVGSDVGKWGSYIKETKNNRISSVTFGPNVRAEHVDIKEGSSGTTVENCTFNGTGIAGANYADSFIDVKGNNDVIKNNVGYRNGNSKIVDAFQVHERVSGWGQNASFTGNTLYLDNATPYVVNADTGATATASNNTRSPSGNMYKGSVN